MPLYSYTARDGETLEIEYGLHAKRPDRVRRKGKTFTRNIAADHNGFDMTNDRGWPIYSDSAGVAPSQVAEAVEVDKKLGVPARYLKDGRVVFENRNHQRRWLKAHGMRNWDENF